MDNLEANHLEGTTAFLILALTLIALPFLVPVVLAMK